MWRLDPYPEARVSFCRQRMAFSAPMSPVRDQAINHRVLNLLSGSPYYEKNDSPKYLLKFPFLLKGRLVEGNV